MPLFGNTAIKQNMIFLKKNTGKMKDRISYEERRKNIDRVMKMTQKCDSAKKDRRDNAKNTNGESFPKHESHQKRQPCMTRKKQIGAKNGLPNDV